VVEGFRCYGGPARQVFRFLEYASEELEHVVFDSNNDATIQARYLKDEEDLTSAVVAIMEMQEKNGKELAKAKAKKFAKIPVKGHEKSHGSYCNSTHICRLLFSKEGTVQSRYL
jgi:hypothetical protein